MVADSIENHTSELFPLFIFFKRKLLIKSCSLTILHDLELWLGIFII